MDINRIAEENHMKLLLYIWVTHLRNQYAAALNLIKDELLGEEQARVVALRIANELEEAKVAVGKDLERANDNLREVYVRSERILAVGKLCFEAVADIPFEHQANTSLMTSDELRAMAMYIDWVDELETLTQEVQDSSEELAESPEMPEQFREIMSAIKNLRESMETRED